VCVCVRARACACIKAAGDPDFFFLLVLFPQRRALALTVFLTLAPSLLPPSPALERAPLPQRSAGDVVSLADSHRFEVDPDSRLINFAEEDGDRGRGEVGYGAGAGGVPRYVTCPTYGAYAMCGTCIRLTIDVNVRYVANVTYKRTDQGRGDANGKLTRHAVRPLDTVS